MQIINTSKAPEALGPYSQAIKFNGLIFSSGQIALDPKTMQIVEGGIKKQTEQVLSNLQSVLVEAGSNKSKVIKTTIFLKNIEDFQVVNGIYESFFEGHKPARSTIEISRLPKDALIEIELIAKL